jgi:hypothetical protein
LAASTGADQIDALLVPRDREEARAGLEERKIGVEQRRAAAQSAWVR